MAISVPDWRERQERARADALSQLEGNASSREAAATISDMLQRFIEAEEPVGHAGYFSSTGFPAIMLELRKRGLTDWASALEIQSKAAPQTVFVGSTPIEILIGRGAGDFCGKSPGEREFALVRHLRDAIRFLSADFLPVAERTIRAGTDRQQATLKTMLHRRAEGFPTDPDSVAHISSRDRPHLIGKDGQGLRFADVWHGPIRYTVVWLHDADAYDLLRRVDSEAYLELLEDFPLREAVYELIRTLDGSATVSELCLLLGQARPGFDGEGSWITENQVVFLILNLLGERLLLQVSEDGTLNAEFHATLSEIIEALTARGDKVPLGYAWFEHLLMFRGRSQRQRKPAVVSSVDAALLSVAAELSAQLPPYPSPISWINAQQEVRRNGRIYTLLALELPRRPVDTAAIAALIEKVILGDLVSSVGIEQLIDSAGVERLVIANAMALIPDPAAWFRDLWNRLFWLRVRARGHRSIGSVPVNVGHVITVWVACGLELLDAGSDSARALWIELERAVREAALTDFFRPQDDVCEKTLRFLGGVWRRTFPEDPPSGTPGSLDDFVAPWLNVNPDLGRLAVILRRYDVQPNRLLAVGVSGSLLRLIIEDAVSGRRPLLAEAEIAAVGSWLMSWKRALARRAEF